MALKLVTAAPAVVSLDDAKRHLRVLNNDDDTYIESLVSAATAWIDGKDGWLGRAIGTQTWDLALDAFPSDGIIVPLPPLQSVTSVKYVSPDTGLDVTLTADVDYVVDLFGDPGWIMPSAAGWPTPMATINAVKIRFVAGYATIPAPIKQAILMLVGHWYENREAASETKIDALPMAVDALLYPYRNWQN